MPNYLHWGITDGKLSPEYARDTYEYTLSVGEKVKEITLNPKSYNAMRKQ